MGSMPPPWISRILDLDTGPYREHVLRHAHRPSTPKIDLPFLEALRPKLRKVQSCPELSTQQGVQGPRLYNPGDFLKLVVQPSDVGPPSFGFGGPPRWVTAEVVKTFEPFTSSCAILVRIHDPSTRFKGLYFLKLLDFRCLPRNQWSQAIETQYRVATLRSRVVSHLSKNGYRGPYDSKLTNGEKTRLKQMDGMKRNAPKRIRPTTVNT
jgi:hypothetical protein